MRKKHLLTLVFRFGAPTSGEILNGIEKVLVSFGASRNRFSVDGGKPTSLQAVMRSISKRGEDTFRIESDAFDFDFSPIRNHSLSFLEVGIAADTPIPFDAWIRQFSSTPDFINAWFTDSEYSYWQNAQDPLQFVSAGKPFEHLPQKSNGLPFPLEQTVIDTTSNPGRRILRDGYIEAIGSPMWFGRLFWEVVCTGPSALVEIDGAKSTTWEDGTTKLEVGSEVFSSGEGLAGQKQERLRNAIFS